MKEILLKNGHIEIDEMTGHYELFNLDGDFVEEGTKDTYMTNDELLEYLKKERV
jgi:hypothetical protein